MTSCGGTSWVMSTRVASGQIVQHYAPHRAGVMIAGTKIAEKGNHGAHPARIQESGGRSQDRGRERLVSRERTERASWARRDA